MLINNVDDDEEEKEGGRRGQEGGRNLLFNREPRSVLSVWHVIINLI